MYNTLEGIDGWKHSREIITVPLKEHVAGRNFFFEINILLLKELLKQWLTASSPVKINTAPFKEWMNSILSVTKTDTLLQGMDGYN